MNGRLLIRQLLNRTVKIPPHAITRHLLKSLWRQPRLQDALGYHVQPYRYDSAIPTTLDVDLDALKRRRALPGLRLDPEVYLGSLEKISQFAPELATIPDHAAPGLDFWFRNGAYGELDAATLYCMVRHLKPKRLIEVGCGFSSRMIDRACGRNREEGHPCESIFIEPYPSQRFLDSPPAGEFMKTKIELVPLEIFQRLRKDDILFIDTSHVLKTQNDCCRELLEIIPSLAPGVVVHVHDIFTPYDYPAEWLFERQFPFNEQYALECLLSDSPRYEVILPVFLLWTEHRAKMKQLLPSAENDVAAFWFGIRSE